MIRNPNSEIYRAIGSSRFFLPAIGIIAGLSFQLNQLSSMWKLPKLLTVGMVLLTVLLLLLFTVIPHLVRAGVRQIVRRSSLPDSIKDTFPSYDSFGFLPLILLALGAFGVQFPIFCLFLFILLYLLIEAIVIYTLSSKEQRARTFHSFQWLSFLFFLSGFAALIYQIVWQRVLFSSFGVNIECVTITVSLFMFGLGIGSLVGGMLSMRFPQHSPQLFLLCELGIGLFGIISIPLIDQVSAAMLHGTLTEISLSIYTLLSLPTIGMGATLPILVGHFNRYYGSIGKSVGVLYFINTIGAAVACFMTTDLLFVFFGLQTTVYIAVICNLTVAVLVFRYTRATARIHSPQAMLDSKSKKTGTVSAAHVLQFVLILLLSMATGYISLSQEILWFRVISYITGGLPHIFAYLLGFFLVGIALGALAVKWVCERMKDRTLLFIAAALTLSGLIYYFSIPITARILILSERLGLITCYLLVSLIASLVGAVFPLACHYGIRSSASTGIQISLIYFANILGSMTGPLLTGFVLLNLYSLEQCILYLSLATLLLAWGVWLFCSRSVIVRLTATAMIALCLAGLAFAHNRVYSNVLERLQYKSDYTSKPSFKHVVQNRSGIITVESAFRDIIYGGGIYDGMFNTDPVNNLNGIRRAYMIAALHPAPEEVLEIGLSSGSWARVVVDHAGVKRLTIVEINPGYLDLIQTYPEIGSISSDPKVTLVVDDGRRWLNRHPDLKFDFILMNTTFHFRDHATNLLSEEFLSLCKNHLKAKGVLYFNTTDSENVIRTASQVFKHVTRYANFIAAGDSPFSMSPEQKRENLLRFQRNGLPLFRHDVPELQKVLDELVVSDTSDVAPSFRNRADLRVITDDNMFTEYKISKKWFNGDMNWIKRILMRASN
ncbi:MAG: spermidine synthase [Deltaproteobacteria bacterium]